MCVCEENGKQRTVLGETRTGKMVPWVVRSLRKSPPSFTDSREDSERGSDSTITFTPAGDKRSAPQV